VYDDVEIHFPNIRARRERFRIKILSRNFSETSKAKHVRVKQKYPSKQRYRRRDHFVTRHWIVNEYYKQAAIFVIFFYTSERTTISERSTRSLSRGFFFKVFRGEVARSTSGSSITIWTTDDNILIIIMAIKQRKTNFL